MTRIKSPPAVVAAAEEIALLSSLFSLSFPLSDNQMKGVSRIASGLSALLPHVDKATLVIIVDYMARYAQKQMEGLAGGRIAPDAYAIAAASDRVFAHVVVDLANDMLDDLAADEADRKAHEWEADLLNGAVPVWADIHPCVVDETPQPEPAYGAREPDADLPGMWEAADLTGGLADAEDAA